ncbi:MAG: peptidylprolyl isomerase [Phycisphaerae bacterium]
MRLGKCALLAGACFVAGCAILPQSPARDAGAGRAVGDEARPQSPAYHASTTGPVDALVINGETVKAIDLCRERSAELQQQARALSPLQYREYVEREASKWIVEKMTETLLYQRASLHYSPEMRATVDKYVDGEIRRIVTESHGGVERRFEKHLASLGRDIEAVRSGLRRRIIIASFLESEIKPKVVEPTRTELLAAFRASSDAYRVAPRRRMSLIDVRVRDRLDSANTDPTAEQLAAAREEARSIIQMAKTEIVSGQEFASVARRYSDGLHSTEGGDWGWVRKGSVRERFEPAVDALFQLDVGQVSEVVEADDGYFLVRCDEVDPGVEPSFQDAQPALRASLSQASYERLLAGLLAELRSKARIEPPDIERFHAGLVAAAMGEEFTNPGRP